ncbi:MAG TPA: VanZ family protein [Candidatus Galloscillospira excrementipullorum]|nr:VanZ family protein [Candidatus Galloscillospira excrementipullorum]
MESLQPVIGRSFDVDDLMLNFIGILVGYWAAVGIKTFSCERG